MKNGFLFVFFAIFYSSSFTQNIQPGFTAPDTVCINTPVTLKNTSIGASNYYWNFCVADINSAPTGVNIGNINSNFNSPVFIDYAYYNGNYYGFVINYSGGALIRLDFGNSLLNTPTSINLGNFGGIIPSGIGGEGIQIINSNDNWYAIIVGGYTPAGNTPRILKIDFGANLANLNPTATNWGNLGNMLQPIDLHVFKENNNWYGFTVNAENNTITRFSFTNSFSNTPTAINLGNIGNLSYPTGIYAINDNGYWRVFITNAGNNTRLGGPCSITRLDFGSSLLNIPTAINLGNPGNMMQHTRDLTIMKFCNQIVGFAVNGNPNYNDLLKLNFNNDLSAPPTITSLGNVGNLNFPHSISKLFRVNNDIYSFITNVANNTITRLKFTGCNNSSLPNSSQQNPPDIAYDSPGTYNINLTIDEGLPSQNTFCKQIVVLPAPVHHPSKDISICEGETVRIGTVTGMKGYKWNTGASTDSITVKTSGIYWVETLSYGCTNRDTFNIIVNTIPVVKLSKDTSVCKGTSFTMAVQAGGVYNYTWFPTTGLSNSTISNPVITVNNAVQYIITATNANNSNCLARDTLTVQSVEKPVVDLGADTILCSRQTLLLDARNPGSTYAWSNSSAAKTLLVNKPGVYAVVVSKNGCSTTDSVKIDYRSTQNFTISPTRITICANEEVIIKAGGGNGYEWFKNGSPLNVFDSILSVRPTSFVTYNVRVIDSICLDIDTLSSIINLKPSPAITIAKMNDINCITPKSQLSSSGGIEYSWSPKVNISDPNISNPVVYPYISTRYKVRVKGTNGCINEDSIYVIVNFGASGNLYVPSAFTPNNDGKNDCFSVKYFASSGTFEISIFNRFGEKVFYSTSSNECWNGKFKGQEQPAGAYVYIIKVDGICGKEFKKGTLVLFR